MIRNLKVLLAAAMALAAFGAFSASAHAAEEKFHCSVEPCTYTLNPDGAVPSATAHHVFIVKNTLGESISFTCRQLTGHATSSTKTTEELTFTNLVYHNCTGNGAPVSVRMNSCHYTFTSKNGAIGGTGAEIHVGCSLVTKHIEIELTETGCVLEVTPQTLKGAHYRNIGTSGTSSTEVTAEASVPNIAVELAKEGIGCLIKTAGQTLTGEYTTGNTLVTAEKDNASKEMVEGWWA